MAWLIWLLGALSLVIYILASRMTRLARLGNQIPGPLALPLIGNLLQIIVPKEEMIASMFKLLAPYDKLCRLWLLNNLMVIVKHPDALKIVLEHEGARERKLFYEFIAYHLGHGILTAPAETSVKIRKQLLPLFNTLALNSCLDFFNYGAKRIMERLDELVDKPPFEIYDEVFNVTVEVVYNMEVKNLPLKPGAHKMFVDIIRRTEKAIAGRMFKPWLHNNFVYHLTEEGKDAAKLSNDAKEFIDEFLRQKRNYFEELKDENGALDPDCTFGRRTGFSERMLLAQDEDPEFWNHKVLTDNILTIFPAASDSSATTVAYVMALLGIHPNIQKRVAEELDTIFENSNRNTTLEDLSKMEYLEQIIKETMRLFPATPFISRQVTQDIHIDKYTIPQGACCLIPIAYIHRDPKYWKNPNEFNPDRFAPDMKPEPYTYLPFSAGPRNCVGYRYAMIFVKTILSTILRSFEVTTSLQLSDLKLVQQLTLSTEGVTIQLHKRNIDHEGE